ncbi:MULTISPECIES: CinA family protein [unclassified Polynucleobacter]|uniref:CinA family protein n=1 Tax=unclassified Polynucleobacter TaxID=2640945 RepID=UPI00257271FD|nr:MULTISPECIES: CinA family protein [unclassified Polynucleobacter]BEI42061.1 CinA family protein [Polynucleobacter sp. HIN10]BEI43839.1 CinA family protein [Polynucleobacter sp. HIN11]
MNSSITPLVQQLAQTLLAKGLKIASAESCTGGLLAAHLTSLAGSSDWFERGFITYSNQAKEESIGVSKELIEQYGAVSEEVAKAMAKGALNHSLAQVSVAITGIAGPGGGSANKPVGMICFAWGVRVDDQIQTRAQTKHFSGDRQSIREQACVYAIESLLGQLTASESH